jgi:hypothetical protein
LKKKLIDCAKYEKAKHVFLRNSNRMEFEKLITKLSRNVYLDNPKGRAILFSISRRMSESISCQQFLHQCNQREKQRENFY